MRRVVSGQVISFPLTVDRTKRRGGAVLRVARRDLEQLSRMPRWLMTEGKTAILGDEWYFAATAAPECRKSP